ncbi:MAG: periplasmic heavy metal sensor [Dinoroseobacter sp.]|nr:periplasmic heavy metal sensor [Dinoroseobacter sp.]
MSEPSRMPGWSRGRTILFYLSLGLNILVIGVLLGAVLSGGRPGPRATIDGPFPMLRALSDEERTQFTQIIRANREMRTERPVKSLQRGRKLLELVSAEKFDAARFEALLKEQSQAAAGRADAGRVALTMLLSRMSLADRQAFASRLEEMLKRSVRERRKQEDGRRTLR